MLCVGRMLDVQETNSSGSMVQQPILFVTWICVSVSLRQMELILWHKPHTSTIEDIFLFPETIINLTTRKSLLLLK